MSRKKEKHSRKKSEKIKAKKVDPANPETYYNLGGAYFSIIKNLDSAEFYFQKTLTMNPNHEQAKQGLASVKTNKGK